MTIPRPIRNNRTQVLRKLHAIGKTHGLTHEALRGFVGVLSLADASAEQLHAACSQLEGLHQTQGGQYRSPLPREPRSAWRPQPLPQKPPTPTFGWCSNCHMPSPKPLCDSCKKKLNRPNRQPTHQTQAPTLDLGPLPTPHLAIRGVDHSLITRLLAEGIYAYDCDHSADRYEWSGYLKRDALADIETWMRRHGAIQPSHLLPCYWTLENEHLKLSLNTTGSGRSHITLLDYSESTAPSSNRTTQPQVYCEVTI